MKAYESLYKRHKQQAAETAFAHFYPVQGDYDEPFKIVARQTVDGIDAWSFQQDRFRIQVSKHCRSEAKELSELHV